MNIKHLILLFFLALGPAAWCAPPSNGFHREYYGNGRTREEGRYMNGMKHRTWFYYNENGTLTHKEKWKNGVLVWQIFYEKGKVTRTIDKDGKVTEKPKCGC